MTQPSAELLSALAAQDFKSAQAARIDESRNKTLPVKV
jgi:hypothetical protein